MEVIVKNLNEKTYIKLKKFLEKNNYDFEDDVFEFDRLREGLITVKKILEDNNIELVKIIFQSHYHPDYNCDEIIFDAPNYKNYWNADNSKEDEDLHEKLMCDLFNGIDIDLYFKLYSLEEYQDEIEEILKEINFKYSAIVIDGDSDH